MAKSNVSELADAIRATLISPNVADSNMEAANVVDTIADASRGIWRLSRTIVPAGSSGTDATGKKVESLAEAVMGVTAGLMQIARAIDGLTLAVRDHGRAAG